MKKGEPHDSPFFYTPHVTKRKKVLNLKLLGVLAVLVCLLLSGCGRKTRLKDGFKIVDGSNDVNALIDPDNRVLVSPNVTNVVDNERFIIGLREDVDFGSGDLREDQFGYFIYDKETRELIEGLSEREFQELSQEKGIDLRLE